MNIKLSFVIPAHNEEERIGRCLDSILRDSEGRNDVEVIVVNNASTDETENVVRRYRTVRLVREERKGIVWARRAGFLEAKGDLIANVDADTMLTPGWITVVLREFNNNGKLVALSGPFIYYDLSNLEQFWVAIFYRLGFALYIVNRFILNIGSMLQGGNFVVKRAAIERIGGYNTSIDFYGEDTDLARRLHKIGGVKFTFELPMYSSGRRLREEGILRIGLRYAINYFWTIFGKRPYTKTSTDIRTKTRNHT
jgi:glycosyltransferase involved in cell wall biosynthesis